MSSSNLRLYADAQFASPYAMSVLVALYEKGLLFELVTVDLANNANLEPEYVASSLTQRVPTLVHDSFALSESSAITEYLDEVFRAHCYIPKTQSGELGHVKFKLGCEVISCPSGGSVPPRWCSTGLPLHPYLPQHVPLRKNCFLPARYCLLTTHQTFLASGALQTPTLL